MGSSPRGRGKHLWQNKHDGFHRLIPAWAGKTPLESLQENVAGAHPRVGGENTTPALSVTVSHGSSPRGRGKPYAASEARIHGRLIPAWAGKTASLLFALAVVGAHPRVGGENVAKSSRPSTRDGSSPRGRGKHPVAGLVADSSGLIPAWAGKTRSARQNRYNTQAHPRVGGENGLGDGLQVPNGGSSPRGRGKPHEEAPLAWQGRLIPAWAGKTQCRVLGPGAVQAHPRVGGENFHPRERC